VGSIPIARSKESCKRTRGCRYPKRHAARRACIPASPLEAAHPQARSSTRTLVTSPVAPARTCNQLRNEVDEVVCVHMPQSFHAIGQFYVDFSQVSDEEVVDWLNRAQRLAAHTARVQVA
jgi:hypothetical protein